MMLKRSLWLWVPAAICLVLGILGMPLPPLYSRSGVIHSYVQWRAEMNEWSASPHVWRYAYSSWVWGSFGVLMASVAALVALWPVLSPWRRRNLKIFTRAVVPTLLMPSFVVIVGPSVFLASLHLGQSNYLREELPLWEALLYAGGWTAMDVALSLFGVATPEENWSH